MHEWFGQVRDYEVDFYGGVNAATYLNYFEEGRKHFLASVGIHLVEFYKRGIGFVVSRYEIDYRRSLVNGDDFVVQTSMERATPVKVEFTQQILRKKDMKLAVTCKNFGLAIDVSTNKMHWHPELDVILASFPIRSAG